MKRSREEIEAIISLSVSCIGIGNAGNQICRKAKENNIPTVIMNTSVKDLTSDNGIDYYGADIGFIVGNEGRGAGKSRERAKSLFKMNGKNLFLDERFVRMIEDSDVVFVVASTAGGTGSGIAPEMIKILKAKYPYTIFIFCGIFPKIFDSLTAQSNTIECMKEIEDLNVPYMLSDLHYYENTSNESAYTAIADHMVYNMSVIRGDHLRHSEYGMIDENDMKTIVSEPGYMAIYSAKSEDLSHKSLLEKVKSSPAVMIQHDKIIRQMGIMVHCPSDLSGDTKNGNYRELTEALGMPIAIFDNFAVSDNINKGHNIVIVSGMSIPIHRIQRCTAIINEHATGISKTSKARIGDDDENALSLMRERVGRSDRFIGNKSDKLIVDEGILDSFF